MKNIFKLLFASLFVVNFSCHDSENVIDGVLDYETGAILRTISVDNAVLNSSDPESAFMATVEAQDEADGALLSEIRVNALFRDLSPDNGTTEAQAFVYSISASETYEGPVGLPRADISMSFGAAAAAMALSPSDYEPGDVVIVQLEIVLTDGRVYGPDSAAGIITGGFFSSPFQYNALLTCSPQPGDYVVAMQDSYGDGWQSAEGIAVNIDGTTVYASLCNEWGDSPAGCVGSGTSNYEGQVTISIPEGTESATWTYTGDSYPGEVSFQIYAPDGSLILDLSEPGPGLLPVAVCAQ